MPPPVSLDMAMIGEEELRQQHLTSPHTQHLTSPHALASMHATAAALAARSAEVGAGGYPRSMDPRSLMHPSPYLQHGRGGYDMSGYDQGLYERSMYGASATAATAAAAANAAASAAAYEAYEALYGADLAGRARQHHVAHYQASVGAPPGSGPAAPKDEGVEFLQALLPNTRIHVKQGGDTSAGMPRPPMGHPAGGHPYGGHYGAASLPGGGLMNIPGLLGGPLGQHNPLMGPSGGAAGFNAAAAAAAMQHHAATVAAAAAGTSPGAYGQQGFNAAAAAAAANAAAAAAAMQQHAAVAAAAAAGTLPGAYGQQGQLRPNHRGNQGTGHIGAGSGGGGGGNRRKR